MTQAQFDKGYRSTADSNETLVGISTASDGDLAAEVTFTSHQNRRTVLTKVNRVPTGT